MIIFGFKQLSKLLATLSYVCNGCGQPAAHRIFSRWNWFSLFFIPVIPLGTKRYYDTCIACGRTVRLSKEQAQGIIGQPPADPGRAQIDPRHGQASPAVAEWAAPAQPPAANQWAPPSQPPAVND
ncbi:MAG TPA: zinc-ribbon domain-containing protein [Jatrophihabitans sp.]|nr:zinc-ribbon domain-containing protein [Jatrophihabitans sp.]